MAQHGDQATHAASGLKLGVATGAALGAAPGAGTGTGTGIGGAYADGNTHDTTERASKGPGPAAVGRGHRPALNDWKFPSTPRVATPAPYEPQLIQSDARPSSPSIGTSHQQPVMDYFTHPVSMTAQQQLQPQQQLQLQLQQQQQQQVTQSYASSSGPFRDGSQTPKSPYSFSEAMDSIPTEDASVQHQAHGIRRNTHSQNHSQSQSQIQGQSHNHTQSHSQTHSQSYSHSHSQSQDSVGVSVEQHPGILHNLPAYQHQMLHDAAQPGHSTVPSGTHLLVHQQQQLGMPLMPHQLQTPSEFALKMLFTQFVKMAEAKLNAMVHLPLVSSSSLG